MLHRRRGGFTLLEMVVAFTILALFILPMLEIVAASRVRAIKYSRERLVRDLGQRKLFERIYLIETMDNGTFEAEGHPEWTWEIPEPEPVSQGAQLLLQYTIQVRTPQGEAAAQEGGELRSDFEMSVWTYPSQAFLDEQAELQSRGYGSVLDTMGGLYGR